jgi:hypothetical protein
LRLSNWFIGGPVFVIENRFVGSPILVYYAPLPSPVLLKFHQDPLAVGQQIFQRFGNRATEWDASEFL